MILKCFEKIFEYPKLENQVESFLYIYEVLKFYDFERILNELNMNSDKDISQLAEKLLINYYAYTK